MVRSRLSTRRSRIIAGVVVAVVAWGVACALLLSGARSDMEAGRDALREARSGLAPATLVGGSDDSAAVDAALESAMGRFGDADASLSHPVLAPARLLPVVGRHIRAAESVNGGAAEAAAVAESTLRRVRSLAADPPEDGRERIRLLEELGRALADARSDIAAIRPGSPRALVGPFGDAIETLERERDDAVGSLDRAGEVTAALATLLDGPSRHLLVGANNAEMRAGTGMFLSAAPITFDAGAMELGDVRPTRDLIVDPPVPVDGDMAANFAWADPGADLRQLMLSPDLPSNAEVARAHREASGGGEVAGLIVIDVDGLRSLLRVVGPVDVDGVTYDVHSVRGELLGEQYRRAADDPYAVDEREERIGEVARAVFQRLDAGEWAVADLATALTDMVQRRNLMLWSAEPAIQRAWRDAGASGELVEDTVSVALVNRGANKLDPRIEVDHVVETTGGDHPEITIRSTFTSTASASGPRYQVGPNIEGLEAGDYRGIVVHNLPGGSIVTEVEGVERFLDGTDGPTTITAGSLDIAPGEEVVVQITASLPAGIDRLVIEPSARIPRTGWTIDGRAYETDRRRTVAVGDS